jgi:hypothetical protein
MLRRWVRAQESQKYWRVPFSTEHVQVSAPGGRGVRHRAQAPPSSAPLVGPGVAGVLSDWGFWSTW